MVEAAEQGQVRRSLGLQRLAAAVAVVGHILSMAPVAPVVPVAVARGELIIQGEAVELTRAAAAAALAVDIAPTMGVTGARA